jgi:hypothetical protein
MKMNERLISPFYRNNVADLRGNVVKFDQHGLCEGIVRVSGEMPLPEPKPITAEILDEARKSPALFVVIPDPAELEAASIAKAELEARHEQERRELEKRQQAEIESVGAPEASTSETVNDSARFLPDPDPIEVEGKTVVDAPEKDERSTKKKS